MKTTETKLTINGTEVGELLANLSGLVHLLAEKAKLETEKLKLEVSRLADVEVNAKAREVHLAELDARLEKTKRDKAVLMAQTQKAASEMHAEIAKSNGRDERVRKDAQGAFGKQQGQGKKKSFKPRPQQSKTVHQANGQVTSKGPTAVEVQVETEPAMPFNGIKGLSPTLVAGSEAG